MKFFITEGNIGGDATRETAERVIRMLEEKGWDVAYGLGDNRVTDISEFGREEKLMDAFADDFMACIEQLDDP